MYLLNGGVNSNVTTVLTSYACALSGKQAYGLVFRTTDHAAWERASTAEAATVNDSIPSHEGAAADSIVFAVDGGAAQPPVGHSIDEQGTAGDSNDASSTTMVGDRVKRVLETEKGLFIKHDFVEFANDNT